LERIAQGEKGGGGNLLSKSDYGKGLTYKSKVHRIQAQKGLVKTKKGGIGGRGSSGSQLLWTDRPLIENLSIWDRRGGRKEFLGLKNPGRKGKCWFFFFAQAGEKIGMCDTNILKPACKSTTRKRGAKEEVRSKKRPSLAARGKLFGD